MQVGKKRRWNVFKICSEKENLIGNATVADVLSMNEPVSNGLNTHAYAQLNC